MKILPNTSLLSTLILAAVLSLACTLNVAVAQNETQEPISQAELEQILAPIALYPDSILSHILVAATYPLEIVQAERWANDHPELEGQEAVEAAQENDWDPSVMALVAFPQVLKRMSQDLDWTQRLGEAFLQSEEQVLASVQNLRVLAQEAGSLDEMDKVTVTRDERVIIIEPREREIVYVPYYDTRVVYGSWRWRHHQPVFWDYPYAYSPYSDHYYAHNRHSSFFWGPRISLSFGFFSNSFHWHNHHIVRISPKYYNPRRYYSHHDIINHQHAQRWRHDYRRSHYGNYRKNYGRTISGRYDKQPNYQRPVREDHRVQRSPSRPISEQREVESRLAAQRSKTIDTRAWQKVESTRAHTSVPRQSAPRSASGRIGSIDDHRRVESQPAPQPVIRQPQIQSSRQVNRAPAVSTHQQPVVRQAPRAAAPQPATKPSPQPRQVAVERKTTPQPKTDNRRVQRQPR